MDLNEYLWRYQVKQNDFSEKVSINVHGISNLVRRRNSPSLLNAIKIVNETKGLVTFEDLLKHSDMEEYEKHLDNAL